ncbi:Acetylcholinesterase [Armadillidium nasatum]|uniref:Carboxylic ester hydrolase n=1 Tax=Armadillidium nasatum TaxID=96803 RepID=A0A5N5SQF5_9CRUS|nr:Acetylcholinesterase [Armadillidium nasatum]
MPASCLQVLFFSTFNYEDGKESSISGREDCVHLNVFTPAPNEPERKLPVMVFIHGGGFVGGKASDYHPNVLMNKEIVLVVIQYRLGIFGFLSTEDSVMRGNMGLKDQQLALKWVKENVESFGGDSGNITIFGESAGGASVHYHILSPGSNGLFNRAIIQSGTSFCPWASNMNHKKYAIETGREFNCSIDNGTEKYLECMQTVHPYYLIIAGAKTNILGFGPLYTLPRVDGEFITEPPELLMRKRKYNKVDIIAGITKDEGGYEFLLDYIIPKRRGIINKNFEKYGPISLMFENEENSLELTKKVYQLYLQRENFTTNDEDFLKISEEILRVSFNEISVFLFQIFVCRNPTPSGSEFIWKEATTESFQYLSLTTSPAMKPDDFLKREFWTSLNTTQNKILQDTLQEETGNL